MWARFDIEVGPQLTAGARGGGRGRRAYLETSRSRCIDIEYRSVCLLVVDVEVVVASETNMKRCQSHSIETKINYYILVVLVEVDVVAIVSDRSRQWYRHDQIGLGLRLTCS